MRKSSLGSLAQGGGIARHIGKLFSAGLPRHPIPSYLSTTPAVISERIINTPPRRNHSIPSASSEPNFITPPLQRKHLLLLRIFEWETDASQTYRRRKRFPWEGGFRQSTRPTPIPSLTENEGLTIIQDLVQEHLEV